jgi:hypothetical protein
MPTRTKLRHTPFAGDLRVVFGDTANPADCSIHGQFWSVLDTYTGWQSMAKLCNNSKTLPDYMRHIAQQYHSRKTHAQTAATHRTTFKIRASLLQVHKTL